MEKPLYLKGPPIEWQGPFFLEPVGLDWDGTIRPILGPDGKELHMARRADLEQKPVPVLEDAMVIAARVRLHDQIAAGILDRLGRPPLLASVTVHPLFLNRFRVNVHVHHDTAMETMIIPSTVIAHSYFVVGESKVFPAVVRTYGERQPAPERIAIVS